MTPTVAELQDDLRARNLPVSGTKDELEARLADAVLHPDSQPSPVAAPESQADPSTPTEAEADAEGRDAASPPEDEDADDLKALDGPQTEAEVLAMLGAERFYDPAIDGPREDDDEDEGFEPGTPDLLLTIQRLDAQFKTLRAAVQPMYQLARDEVLKYRGNLQRAREDTRQIILPTDWLVDLWVAIQSFEGEQGDTPAPAEEG